MGHLMMDFIEKADAAMQPGSHRTADLRFGHDTSILPLFALMGVDDPQNRNLPYKEAHAKGWYAFFQVPMATNCQMIFYQNKKGEVLTKVLYNEKEILIPGIEPVSGPYYRWDELKAHFLDLCKQASAPWDNWNMVLLVGKSLFKVDPAKELAELEAQDDTGSHPRRMHVAVENPAIFGKKLSDILHEFNGEYVVSRIMKGKEILFATGDIVLEEGDKVLIIPCH